jgi:alpha/beta hydrolase family protein
MNRLLKMQVACLLVGTATVVGSGTAAAQGARPGNSDVTAVPKVTGPLPVTSDSFPFLAADRNLQPTDLKKYGYVEEEFIVTGTANVYDWAADGALTVKTPGVPYGARILVRRPADSSRFSGDVIVEPLNAVRRFDWPWIWGYSKESFLQHGDAWVGITMPASSVGLKQFNPARYAAVSFPNPTPSACAPAGNAPVPAYEDGLRWDAISQVGALLKSNVASRPLAGLRVAALYMTAGQSPDPMTYINAIHSHANLANGKPVYDGYLVKQPGNAARINQCAPALAAGDPRQAIKEINVPVIAVVAQGEALGSFPWRRADSDEAGNRFRLYEIAGGSHIEWASYKGFPLLQDQAAAGIMPAGTADWPFAAKCDPDIPLDVVPIMTYAFDAAFANLQQWVRKGTPPPHAARLELKDAGTPQASVVTDQAGNGIGGVRSPYVDVPVATYFATSTGPGNCREMGHKVDFDSARIRTLHGTDKDYAAKVTQSVDKLVKERWLTEADGRKIKQGLAARGGANH